MSLLLIKWMQWSGITLAGICLSIGLCLSTFHALQLEWMFIAVSISFILFAIYSFTLNLQWQEQVRQASSTRDVANVGILIEASSYKDTVWKGRAIAGEQWYNMTMDFTHNATSALTEILPSLDINNLSNLRHNQRYLLYRALKSRNHQLVLALLDFVARTQMYAALPNVQKLAEGAWSGEQSSDVNYRAQEVVVLLQSHHSNEARGTLLRSSNIITPSEQLLRPMSNDKQEQPSQVINTSSSDSLAD